MIGEIQKILNKLHPHLVGIRYVEGIMVVDAIFKGGWIVPDSGVIKNSPVEDTPNYYIFFSEEDEIGVDEILEHVKSIVDLNVEREKKHVLLKQKVQELKEVFGSTPLTQLTKMQFSFSDPELNLDEEFDLTVDPPKPETKPKPHPKPQNKKQSRKPKQRPHEVTANGVTVELPPKKVELEDYSLPETDGECDCGPDKACPKCMDSKSL